MNNLDKPIKECTANGNRLIEDSEHLQDFDRFASAYSLSILAQEEFAKTFILILVRDEVLPWTKDIRKTLYNHECKHLIGIIMEWLGPPWEKALERAKSYLDTRQPEEMPSDVGTAINILRHEMIERFKEGYSYKEKEWDGLARKIAEGYKSKLKHRGFYIGISKSGLSDTLHPNSITPDMLQDEIDRAKQYSEFVDNAFRGSVLSIGEYDYAMEIIKVMFKDLAEVIEG